MVGQMDGEAIETVRDRGAGRASGGVIGPEHEMVHEKLRASLEEVRKRSRPVVGIETVLLVDSDPRQFLAPSRKFITAPGEFLFRAEQVYAGSEPILAGSDFVQSHRPSPLVGCGCRLFSDRVLVLI